MAKRSMVGTTRCWVLGSADLSGQEVHARGPHAAGFSVLLTCQAKRSIVGDHTLLGSANLSGQQVHCWGPHAAGFC